MGKISLNFKKASIVCRSADLPQDGQKNFSEMEFNNEIEKDVVFTFEVDPINSANKSVENENLKKYRQQLTEIEQKIGDSFLKTLLTLSGGALGLSLAFIKDIVGENPMVNPKILVASWSLLTISLASILLSLYLGISAYRHAINQIDKGTIYKESVGGLCAKAMPYCNFISISTFISGVIFLFIFAFKNIGG